VTDKERLMRQGSRATTGRSTLAIETLAILPLWLILAVVAVASGRLARAPATVLPLTVASLTLMTLTLVLATPSGRAWAAEASLSRLAWFHAWRILPGAAFLVLHARGQLPWLFAVPGGVGDIVIGVSAPVAAWVATRPGRGARLAYAVWCLLGLVDLAGVVRAAFVCTRADPGSMQLLRELPLGLLPTFLVPLTFAAHLLAFYRLAATRG
jgi:hypothetical protein